MVVTLESCEDEEIYNKSSELLVVTINRRTADDPS